MSSVTRQYLCKKYQCDEATLRGKMESIGIPHSKKLFVSDLILIWNNIGPWAEEVPFYIIAYKRQLSLFNS